MNDKAHQICSDIIIYVRQRKDLTPCKYWLTAIKASTIIDTQLCNAREFSDGIKILDKIAKEVVKQVTEYFLPNENDDSKVLQDNMYNFAFRRHISQHQIYFMDFIEA